LHVGSLSYTTGGIGNGLYSEQSVHDTAIAISRRHIQGFFDQREYSRRFAWTKVLLELYKKREPIKPLVDTYEKNLDEYVNTIVNTGTESTKKDYLKFLEIYTEFTQRWS
jgi:hypothetical protein